MKGYIYKISNLLTKDFYIGSTVSKKRFYEHNRNFKKGRHSAKKLQKLVNEHGVSILKYEYILEVDIENRNELFIHEQKIIDKCVEKQLAICNQNLTITQNISSNRAFLTYELYKECRVIFEIDNFYYHIAEELNIHPDTLNKAFSLESSYLEFSEKYHKEKIGQKEKIDIYMQNIWKYIKHERNMRGLTIYKYLQLLSFHTLGYKTSDFAKILNLEITGATRCITKNFKRIQQAKLIFNSWTPLEMLRLIEPMVDFQLSKSKGKPVPFTLFFYIVYKRNVLGISISELVKTVNMDRSVISRYCNNKGTKNHIELYNLLTIEQQHELYKVIEANPLLLPLSAE